MIDLKESKFIFMFKGAQESFGVLPEVLATGSETVVSSLDCDGETEVATELGLGVEDEGLTRLIDGDFVIGKGDIGVKEEVAVENDIAVGEWLTLGVEETVGERVAVGVADTDADDDVDWVTVVVNDDVTVEVKVFTSGTNDDVDSERGKEIMLQNKAIKIFIKFYKFRHRYWEKEGSKKISCQLLK